MSTVIVDEVPQHFVTIGEVVTSVTIADPPAFSVVEGSLHEKGTSHDRAISVVGLSQTDAVLSARRRVGTDTGLTLTESLLRRPDRRKTDTGLTNTDSMRRYLGVFPSDTGLTQTDSIVMARLLSDTGLSMSDSINAVKVP